MKIEVDGVVYEGTPDELREFLPDLVEKLKKALKIKPQSEDEANLKEIIREVIVRRKIPDGQKDLYRALYRAGNSGLSAIELGINVGRVGQKLAGLLGALGRRVNSTIGVSDDEGINLLLHVERSGDSWHYWLRQETREVLEEEGFDWLQ